MISPLKKSGAGLSPCDQCGYEGQQDTEAEALHVTLTQGNPPPTADSHGRSQNLKLVIPVAVPKYSTFQTYS